MEQLTIHPTQPFGDSVFDRYSKWVERLFSFIVLRTIKIPIVWLAKIPLYIFILWCADALISNESCGFCKDTERRNNYVNARKQMISIIDTFTPLTVLPKSPLKYRLNQLQMAQEYWEDMQEKGDNYYTEFLKEVAKKYSNR